MAFELLFSRFQWVHWVFTEFIFTGVEGVSSHRDRSAKNMFLHDWTASLFGSDLKINDPIESISSEFIDVIVVIDYAVGYASLRSTWTSMKAIPREKSNLPKKKSTGSASFASNGIHRRYRIPRGTVRKGKAINWWNEWPTPPGNDDIDDEEKGRKCHEIQSTSLRCHQQNSVTPEAWAGK